MNSARAEMKKRTRTAFMTLNLTETLARAQIDQVRR
jgi:hypothetical protein